MTEKQMTAEQNLEKIVRSLIMLGYDMGKKQIKNPYTYTCDTNKGINYFFEIIKWHEKECKKCQKRK